MGKNFSWWNKKIKELFSYRTLDILKNLTQEDAELFLKAVSISFSSANLIFIIDSISESKTLTYANWATLQDIGLVTQVSSLPPEISYQVSLNTPMRIESRDYTFIVETNNEPFEFFRKMLYFLWSR